MDLLGLGPYIPLSQEASGGKDSCKANSSSGNGWLCSNPLRLQSVGEEEHGYGGRTAASLPSIFFWNQWSCTKSRIGMHYYPGNQPYMGDVGPGLLERPRLLQSGQPGGGGA